MIENDFILVLDRIQQSRPQSPSTNLMNSYTSSPMAPNSPDSARSTGCLVERDILRESGPWNRAIGPFLKSRQRDPFIVSLAYAGIPACRLHLF